MNNKRVGFIPTDCPV